MSMPLPVEKLGRRLVQDVRDRLLTVFFDILNGNARSRIGQHLFQESGIEEVSGSLRGPGPGGGVVVLRVPHHTVKNLEIVVTDRNLDGDAGSGESYRVDEFDMIAAEYSSGKGTWVDKYGKAHQ